MFKVLQESTATVVWKGEEIKKFLSVLVLGVLLPLASCGINTQTPTQVPTEHETEASEIALELINFDEVVSLTMEEIRALPAVEGWGGFRSSSGVITAPTRYKGVPLVTLLNQDGGIGQSRSLEVFNKDGYAITLFSDNYKTYDVATGDEIEATDPLLTIVAYEHEGLPLNLKSEGQLRLVVISESPSQVVDEYWSVKGVQQLKLKFISVIQEDWTIDLIGSTSEAMGIATFESGATQGCHLATWKDAEGHVWSGIPLFYLLGRVDDEIIHGENAFRDDLAQAGYSIDVISKDSHTIRLDSLTVMRNNNIIVANWMDGKPLTDEDFPLRLVGSDLKPDQMIGGIAQIVIHFQPARSTPTSNETHGLNTETPAVMGPTNATVTLAGLIDVEKTLTIDDLIALGVVNTNLEHPAKGEMDVTGVPFSKVLASVSIKPEAQTATFIVKDGFTLHVPLADLQACEKCLLGWDEESLRAYMPGFEHTFWAEGLNTIIFK